MARAKMLVLFPNDKLNDLYKKMYLKIEENKSKDHNLQ